MGTVTLLDTGDRFKTGWVTEATFFRVVELAQLVACTSLVLAMGALYINVKVLGSNPSGVKYLPIRTEFIYTQCEPKFFPKLQ